MTRLRVLLSKFSGLFRKARLEEQLDEEVRAHLEMLTEENLRRGMSPEDARYTALRQFGNVSSMKEECRETWSIRLIEELAQDVRYGLRQLCRNPGFTAVAIITLALGIGANTAIFSVVNTVLLRPLPYRNSSKIVVVGQDWMGGYGDFSPADFLDVQAENNLFEQMAIYRGWNVNLTNGSRPDHASGYVVTPNLFSLLGVKPLLGRGFLTDGGERAGNRVAVLSYGLWQGTFGGRSSVLGENIKLNGESFIVVGVMPRAFGFPEGAGLWVPSRYAVPAHPLRPNVNPAALRGSHYFDRIIARLRPHVTIAQARAELAVIFKNVVRAHPDSDLKGAIPWIKTLREDETGNIRPALLVLLSATGLVLLIGCANVANLLLARGVTRRRELVVREALGAARGRVVRQLLTESGLLALAGGGVGVVVAYCCFAPLAALLPPELKHFAQSTIDLRVLGFSVVLSVLSACIFGLVPAVRVSRTRLNETLKEGGRAFAGTPHRDQELLFIAETALALVLLIGAGLLVNSFARLLNVNEGFDPNHVLTMQVFLPQARYPDATRRNRFVTQVLAKLETLPGVQSACVATRLPLNSGESTRSIQIEGRSYSPASPTESVEPNYSVISPDFFRVLRIPIVKGRTFTQVDDAKATRVVVVNQRVARTFWPSQDPIGKRIKIGAENGWREVVGVVGDIEQRRLGEPPTPIVYAPYTQDPWPVINVALRTGPEPSSLASAAGRAVRGVDKDEPVYRVRTMEEIVSLSVSNRRLNTVLLSLFAGLALFLTAVGTLGVISYSVARRTHEIGIRMALGAQKGDILKMVVGQGLKLALIGVGIGIAGALALTRFLSSLLYGVKATDPLTFVAVSLILVVVALVACYIPARRAAKVDPMVALRYE